MRRFPPPPPFSPAALARSLCSPRRPLAAHAARAQRVNQARFDRRPPAAAPRADDEARDDRRRLSRKWRTIRDVAISRRRRVGDVTAISSGGSTTRSTSRASSTNTEQKIPRASRAQFSDDSKWVAYFVAEPVRAERSPEAATSRANGPARLELRNLATGTTTGRGTTLRHSRSRKARAR